MNRQLYGLQCGPRRSLQIYPNFRPISFEWHSLLEQLHPFRPSTMPVQTVSRGFFETAVLSALEASLAVKIARHLRALTGAPTQIASAPGFCERALDTGDWDGPLGAGDIAPLAASAPRFLHRACRENAELA